DAPQKGAVISGIPAATADGMVFHAGTAQNADGAAVVSGGRVLCAVGLGDTVADAQARAYAVADQIEFDGCQLRRDIGYRAIGR
ncbi:phosphoribosylamine--glycine ligase, partial [Aquitalea sp. S1-19]|nr:phosphoribosylamine--glycine ligase [Aquitalea sp. S1-19]